MMRRHFFGGRFGRKAGFVAMVLLGAVAIAAFGGLVMLLWNWLMPALFLGARPVDYWQALGLLLLCKILFGGRGHGHGHWHWHARRHHWESMTPEERERFREQFRSRWGERWGSRFGADSEGSPGPRAAGSAHPHDPAA